MAERQEFQLPEELRLLIEDIFGYARSGPGAVARQVAHDNPYECLRSLLETISKDIKDRHSASTIHSTVGHAMPTKLIVAQHLKNEAKQLQVQQQAQSGGSRKRSRRVS